MGRLRDYSQSKAALDLGRAAAAGHRLDAFERTRQGQYAVCSCGWESTPRGRRVATAAAAYWHALEVCAVLDERGRLDLVQWSQAPSSPALRGGVERVMAAKKASDTPSG